MSLDDGVTSRTVLRSTSRASFTRRFQYGLDPETGTVDYDAVARLAEEHKPKMIMAGFSAYSRRMDWQRFRDIADAVGA